MPKMRGTIRLQGTDRQEKVTYVQGKNGTHTRKLQEPGAHLNDENIMRNCSDAGSVNALASTVKNIMKQYARGDCEGNLYLSLLKKMKTKLRDSRLLRLSHVEGADGHSGKKLDKIICGLAMKQSINDGRLISELTLPSPADPDRLEKFFYIRLLLVVWNDKDSNYSVVSKRTRWMEMEPFAKPKRFDLPMEIPAGSTDYMLLCCCVRGEEEKEDRLPPERTIKIMEVGCFEEKGAAILNAYRKARMERPASRAKEVMVEEEVVWEREE